jgi:hypothetical protein
MDQFTIRKTQLIKQAHIKIIIKRPIMQRCLWNIYKAKIKQCWILVVKVLTKILRYIFISLKCKYKNRAIEEGKF